MPFIPLYLLQRGLGVAEIGGLLALMALAGLVANPLWGYAADRWLGVERALFTSATGSAVLALTLIAPMGTTLLVVSVIALWAWRAPLSSLADTIALERLGEVDRVRYSRVRLWMSIGWAIAVVLWGVLLQFGTLDLLPPLYAGTIFLVALWARFAIAAEALERRSAPLHEHATVRFSALPALSWFLVSLLLANAAFAATSNLLPLRIHGLGGGALIVAVAASLQAVAEVPVMLATPRLSRLFSHRGLYVTGCAFHAGVFVAWGFLSDPLSISIVKLAAGVGFALSYVGAVIVVDDLVPRRRRATGQGLAKAVSFGLAPVAGIAVGGLIYGHFGPGAMFFLSAGCAALAGVVAWLVVPAAPASSRPSGRCAAGTDLRDALESDEPGTGTVRLRV